MTQTYGFGNRPKGTDLEIHGDPRIIPSSVHKAADLYSPMFAEVLLSTSIRTKRHRVWVFNAAQMDPSCTYTGQDGPGPAGVCLDRLTALSGRNFHLSLISHKCVCANGCLDTEAGILRVSHTQRVCVRHCCCRVGFSQWSLTPTLKDLFGLVVWGFVWNLALLTNGGVPVAH